MHHHHHHLPRLHNHHPYQPPLTKMNNYAREEGVLFILKVCKERVYHKVYKSNVDRVACIIIESTMQRVILGGGKFFSLQLSPMERDRGVLQPRVHHCKGVVVQCTRHKELQSKCLHFKPDSSNCRTIILATLWPNQK